jgi:hypothetical protein
MKRTYLLFWLLLLGISCPAVTNAQQENGGKKTDIKKDAAVAAEEPEEEPLITVVYTIGNLKSPAQKSYRATLPSTEGSNNSAMNGLMGGLDYGMGGMGGYMGGSGMGMMGGMGGMAGGKGEGGTESKEKSSKTPQKLASAELIQATLDIEELIDIISLTIAPTTWDRVGGSASIQPYKNQDLVISQTRAVHAQIRELLKEINSGRGTGEQSMVVEAYWLLLDSTQLEKLRMPSAAESRKIRITVNPKILEEYARTAPALRGQIVCLNNQTVHIVAGDRRNVHTGSIPVVGGSEAGYQPITANVNVGALLQVCPACIPGMNSVIVDIESTVTNWHEGLEPLKIESTSSPADVPIDPIQGAASIKQPGKTSSVTLMDHLQMPAHQIACTLKVPLGKPVLVGGLTLDPTKFEAPEDKKILERKQLYLIIRVSECEEE